MFVYYIIFILSFLLCIIDYLPNRLLRGIIYSVFCIFLALLPGFKDIGVDNDSINYANIFQSVENYSFREILSGNYWENIERGYMFINKLIYILGGSINILFLTIAILTGVLNYSIFFKVNRYVFTGLLFYLSFYYLYRDFTQIRYALSCAISFWAVYFLLRKRYTFFFFALLTAFLFHSTAIILVVVLPICYFFKDRYFYLILPVVCLVGIFFNPFPILLSFGGVPEHMVIYLDEEGGGGFMVSVFGFIIILIYSIFFEALKNLKQDYTLYFRLFAIGIALNLLFIQSAIFQRFTYLLFQFGILLLPAILIELQKSKYKPYFVVLHFLIVCFLLYYGIKLISPQIIRPYF